MINHFMEFHNLIKVNNADSISSNLFIIKPDCIINLDNQDGLNEKNKYLKNAAFKYFLEIMS